MTAPRILTEGKTPAQWSAALLERGIEVSERTLRERARAAGACRTLGNTMILLPEHIDIIFGVEPEPVIDAEDHLEALRQVMAAMHPNDAAVLDFFDPEAEGTVYFLRSADRIKIGFATDFAQRIPALKTASPFPLEVVAVVAGDRELEAFLHRIFAEHRRHGEWFEEIGELQKLMAAFAALGVTP